MVQFILVSLAVWRLTALLVYDAGPGDVLVRLRNCSDAIGGPLSCFWCTSVWVALLASLPFWREGAYMFLVRLLALSTAGIILDEFLGGCSVEERAD